MNSVRAKVGVAGYFKMVAHKADAEGNIMSSRVVADWQKNLVTDAGLDLIGTTASIPCSHCRVGSDNTTPTFADTGLGTQVADTTTITSTTTVASTVTPPYYKHTVRTFRFGIGVAAGNLSEMGISNTSSGNLFSRALIKDGFGAPTTITILSDEILDVLWEFRLYQTDTDWTDTINISGDDYDVVVRAENITTSGGDILGISSGPYGFTLVGVPSDIKSHGNSTALGTIFQDGPQPNSGADYSIPVLSAAGYIAGTHYRDMTYFADITQGNNPGGLDFLTTNSIGIGWQVSFDPPLPKDGTKTLSLTFRFAWDRQTI